MASIKRQVRLSITDDTASQRMNDRLKVLEEKYGQVTKNMNTWLTAGYMLSELGGAVVQTWVALDETGDFEGMTSPEKAAVLIELLERVASKPSMKTRHEETAKPFPVADKKPFDSITTDYGS